MILVLGKEKDGKIHLSEDEFKRYINEAYNEGYTQGKKEAQVIYTPYPSTTYGWDKVTCKDNVATTSLKMNDKSTITCGYNSGGCK